MLTEKLAPHFSSLIQKDKRPIAIAFSGGGDSTALLYLLLEWIRSKGSREVFALIVDHGLRAGSGEEAKISVKRARDMGAKVEILTWEGAKPSTAIQEKARNARYALLGDACRRLGVGQLFLGHNQDDQAETIYMRIQNQTGWRGMVGMGPRKISTLWPELYGVEVVRPLLSVSRDELRRFNQENELAYIDDPSNEDQKFTRIRTRETLTETPEIKQQLLRVSAAAQEKLRDEIHTVCLFIFRSAHILEWGGVRLSVNNITVSSGVVVEEGLKYLILAVSGGNQIPTQEQRQDLAKKLASKNFKGATLGGVQFIPSGEAFLLVRDPGAVMGRHGKPTRVPQKLLPQNPVIWDGRFKVETSIDEVSIAPLMAHIEKLSKIQKAKLKEIPTEARAGMPCLLSSTGVFVPYVDEPSGGITVQCLVKERLHAMGVLREGG